MSGGERRKGFLLSTLSAGLLVLAQPPFHLLVLPFLALVPLAVALGRVGGGSPPTAAAPSCGSGTGTGAAPGREAALLGLAFGLVHWGLLLLWIPFVVGPRFPWAYPAFGALLGILGGLSALLGWAVHRLATASRLPLFLAFALAWVGVEWIKGHFPFGLAWPWLGLGVTLTSWPELLGVAEWVGEAGVSFWLALANGLAAAGVLAAGEGGRGKRSASGLWLLAAAVALGPAAAGWARSGALPLEEGPRVAVVGTEVPPGLRLRPEASAQEAMSQVRTALGALAPGSAELILLPEGTLPYALESPEAAPFLQALGALAIQLRTPILVGVLGGAPGRGEDRRSTAPAPALTNSALLLTSSGSAGYRYDKQRLVPGMEGGGFVPGGEPPLLAVGAWRFGTLICYESLFGSLARGYRAGGGEILVNLSSDIWFGGEGRFPGRVFLDQHPAHLVLRAVENRMPVARAANGGHSLLLDPRGRTLEEGALLRRGMVAATLPVHRAPTLFSRTGDLVGPLAALLSLLFLALPHRVFLPGGRRS